MIEKCSKYLNVQSAYHSGESSRSRLMDDAHIFSHTSYRFGHIARALRALQSSLKVSLRIDGDGLLSLQFMMPASQGALIEFRVCHQFPDRF
jgi:hypothetical protein